MASTATHRPTHAALSFRTSAATSECRGNAINPQGRALLDNSAQLRRVASQRGTALVEFLAMFPVLLLVIAGALYFARHLHTQISLSGDLRSCMWQLSAASCELEALPPECKALLAERTHAEEDPTVGRTLERDSQQKHRSTADGSLEIAVRSTLEQQRDIAMGRSVSAAPSRAVSAPALPGLRSPAAVAHYFVPCNLKPASVGDIARSLWQAL